MNSAITIRKTLTRIIAFWQWWQPQNAPKPLVSLPKVTQSHPLQSAIGATSSQRLPFDPLDCEELGVFDLEHPVDRAFDPPSLAAGVALPAMAAVPVVPMAAAKPFRPRRNLGTPGRRDGAGTH
ncbi:MAG: hypothetical protein EA001_10060 [Oscillatoriales cyanobacterium]|nr:MAG: hypothetical protein EA001_10060 [Oscillatoriales cyanobacterium]